MSTEEFHHPNYVKIWAILCGLLVVSVAGPFLEIQAVTLITAFGIAVIKAYLVAANFMHLNVEKKLALYIILTALVFMFLFFFATAPDVMNAEGTNWEKPLLKAIQAEAAAGPAGAHH